MCQKCKGLLVVERWHDHGVWHEDHRCVNCGRRYPVDVQTVQVEVGPSKKPPDPFMFHSHVCKVCGVSYRSVRKTKTDYCSRKCNHRAKYQRRLAQC